jgi:hypothetical protein
MLELALAPISAAATATTAAAATTSTTYATTWIWPMSIFLLAFLSIYFTFEDSTYMHCRTLVHS